MRIAHQSITYVHKHKQISNTWLAINSFDNFKQQYTHKKKMKKKYNK